MPHLIARKTPDKHGKIAFTTFDTLVVYLVHDGIHDQNVEKSEQEIMNHPNFKELENKKVTVKFERNVSPDNLIRTASKYKPDVR